MGKIATSGLKQKAVLWPFVKADENGDPIVSAAVEILVRWESGLDQIMNADGTPVGTTGVVMVDREIDTGSVVWLGKLADLPEEPVGLCEVVGYEEIPDLKGTDPQRNIVIRRWRDQLPDII